MWVAAPAGAGKTTLASSWLASIAQPSLWYGVDKTDHDPAAFFYQFAQGVASLASPEPELPVFNAEYTAGRADFARRYFRAAFDLLPAGTWVVLDNFHLASDSADFADVVRVMFSEAQNGVQFLVLSRSPPGAIFSALGSDRLELVSASELAFTPVEAARLLAVGDIDADSSRAIYALTEGWAAGLVLMREYLMRGGSAVDVATTRLDETAFDYIAAEVFANLSPEVRSFLLRVSFLPLITADLAQAVTGQTDAARILGDLCHRQFFTSHAGGGEPGYRLHHLFMAFLQRKAGTELDPSTFLDVARNAADHLSVIGNTDSAIALYARLKLWLPLGALVRRGAELLIRRGQWETLARWVDMMPADVQDGEPQICYSMALALMPVDEFRSREWFARSYESFERSGDDKGALLAASGPVIGMNSEYSNFAGRELWLQRFVQRFSETHPELTPAEEVRVHVAALCVPMLTHDVDQADPRIVAASERVTTLIRDHADALSGDELFMLAAALADYSWHMGLTQVERVDALMQRHSRRRDVRPLARVRWLSMLAAIYRHFGEYDSARRHWDEAWAIADREALDQGKFPLLITRFELQASSGELTAAAETMTLLDPIAARSKAGKLPEYLLAKCKFLLACGKPLAARQAIELAAKVLQDNSAPDKEIGVCQTFAAYTYIVAGEPDRALALLANALPTQNGRGWEVAESMRRLFVAVKQLNEGSVELERTLRDAFSHTRAVGWENYLAPLPQLAAQLSSMALDLGCEPDFVRSAIRKRGLAPPDGAGEAWPWPVKIATLGRFEVRIEDTPIRFEGKTPRKPLELLKAVIALGGRAVSRERLYDLLWPDAEHQAASMALDTVMSRLRKLLALPDVIGREEGKLGLDAQQAWVDVWAFDREVDALQATLHRAPSVDVTAAVAAHAETILRLYKGPFLGSEEPQRWALAARDRWQNRFLRSLAEIGRFYEEGGQWERAIALYERGVEVDNLAEDLYRRLMHCYLEHGKPAEAARAYRRCREMLSVQLGIPPSADTEALFQSIYRR